MPAGEASPTILRYATILESGENVGSKGRSSSATAGDLLVAGADKPIGQDTSSNRIALQNNSQIRLTRCSSESSPPAIRF
jgi:hypothetical protein